MMTGKYLRPLLALGLGQDSETLASQLRRYGYRTAAFYPPAVFFIDEPKFVTFEQRALDFEYRKVEFADPALRESQLRAYLSDAPQGKPLFVWVHYFEPHEPYVQHPEHRFGDSDLDAYDSEIAAADDGVGRVVDAVREKRPNAIVIVTADHGEEFGDHGGRYHGTTVYEEQVRVPLVVVGAGVRAKADVDVPVQTIDLVPTVLSAMGIPRPARVRGRDSGPLLAHGVDGGRRGVRVRRDGRLRARSRKAKSGSFARSRRTRARSTTSARTRARSATRRARAQRSSRRCERSSSRWSARTGDSRGRGPSLPDALRRGAAGDVSAAEEVAGLLDDVNVEYRREATRVLFDLRSAQGARAAAARARQRRGPASARDGRVGRSCASIARRTLCAWSRSSRRPRSRRAVARRSRSPSEATHLARAELGAWLVAPGVEFTRQREIVRRARVFEGARRDPALVGLLDDVRLRGYVADALGKLGDPSAKAPLLAHFAVERYVGVRPREANALVALGAGEGAHDAAREVRGVARANGRRARDRPQIGALESHVGARRHAHAQGARRPPAARRLARAPRRHRGGRWRRRERARIGRNMGRRAGPRWDRDRARVGAGGVRRGALARPEDERNP